MVGSSLAPKWSKLVPFSGMNHQKSIFYWYLKPLLSEAVEARWYYFFENWLIKLKCPNLLNTLGTMIQENYWSFYPSEPFTLARFNMRHPVCYHNWQVKFWTRQRLLGSYTWQIKICTTYALVIMCMLKKYPQTALEKLTLVDCNKNKVTNTKNTHKLQRFENRN